MNSLPGCSGFREVFGGHAKLLIENIEWRAMAMAKE
jgi:hypothetical protein